VTAPVFSVPAVSTLEVRAYISDAAELKKGTEIVDKQGVINPSRYQNKLFAEVKGSRGEVYKVALAFTDIPRSIKASCTCEAALSRPICKHASALLITWSRSPEAFVVSGAAPSTGSVKVKEGKTTGKDLMKSGVEQVVTLVRELGTAGVAAVGQDRVEQIRRLGESLREHKLGRLSSDIIELASLLSPGAAGGPAGGVPRTFIPSGRYTDLLADILLTAKKLEKHIAGEPLDDRYVEELIGKVWRSSELKSVVGLRLVEIAFQTRETSDGQLVRESRFVDVKTGDHYSERQEVELTNQRRHEPKKSYAMSVLEGASGGVYPGFLPRRLSLERVREEKPTDPDVIAALLEVALPDVGSALAALQEHRRDVFAPDLLPVSVRVDTLFARGSRIEAVDAKGHALHLPDDPSLEERLGNALRDGRLVALLGDVGIDAALPVIRPLAAIVEGPFGAELRTLEEPAGPKRARRGRSSLPVAREPSSWTSVARLAGVSEATIILGELREELADRLVAGLAGLGSRAMGSVATRLRDLELAQLAAIAETCAARTEGSERLSDFIKLYRGISHALVRLAGATHVERETLERVPTYESVFVRRPEARLTPAEIKRLCAEGALNRYEAAVHFAHYYEALPPEELSGHIYTTWADGSTGPYVARAFAAHGALATDAAERVLLSPSGRVAKMTAVRVLQAAGGSRAEEALQRVMEGMEDVALRALAEDALDALDLRRGEKEVVRKRRASRDKRLTDLVKQLLTASQKEARCKAIEGLVELGHRGALPALRRAYEGDATFDVREDAAYAMARLGDTEMVDAFLKLVRSRQEPEIREEVEVAIRALGKLGDVRGLPELLAAYTEGHYVSLVADAIREYGAAALDPLLDRIEAHPEMAGRQAVRNILQNIPAEELGRELVRRFMDRASGVGLAAGALADRGTLLLKLADAQEKSRRLVAKAICERLGASEDKLEKALVKQAERALGLR